LIVFFLLPTALSFLITSLSGWGGGGCTCILCIPPGYAPVLSLHTCHLLVSQSFFLLYLSLSFLSLVPFPLSRPVSSFLYRPWLYCHVCLLLIMLVFLFLGSCSRPSLSLCRGFLHLPVCFLFSFSLNTS
jgi:hypothetical protein